VRPLRLSTSAFLALALSLGAWAESPLALGPGDLRIEQRDDGGYHLFVRVKKGLGSVLLTESTQDPAKKTDSFAYRALERNDVNGDEARMLNGKKLSGGLFFLMDSSPESDPPFGAAFHIFIPWVAAWGYPWSRSGKEFIHDGSFLNIRAFAKPYADYSGPFADNPYIVRVTQASKAREMETLKAAAEEPVASEPTPPKAAPAASTTSLPASLSPGQAKLYIPETLAAFAALVAKAGGELRYASSDKDIAAQVDALVAREKGKSLDLVLCIDTTDTMIGGLAALRSRLPALLAKRKAESTAFRVGLVAYKDYFEEYLYKRFEFTADISELSSELAALECGGGRDIPEAVYEAVSEAAGAFPWSAEARLVVLIGDAPPHPLPRGSVGEAEVEAAAKDSGVEISAVAVPK
jgi:hypothetical protein